MKGDGDLWVFGYGSLMWRPGFPYVETVHATLTGFRRSFCVYSTHHRGTADRPGLVLGLDRGGTCHGLAFRVSAADRVRVLAYLRAREQINGVYRETLVPLELHGHTQAAVRGVTYIVERAHPSYTGPLSVARQAGIIRGARGVSGPNVDYLASTLCRAEKLGLYAHDLQRVMTLVHPFFRKAATVVTPTAPVAPAASPQGRALVRISQCRRTGPRQPHLAERRRFRFRMNREAATDPGLPDGRKS